ncbi:cytochrome c-type biogenesis protein CcmH [Shimia isoporae]|uniref:Cytochrome c-type biogenesis protein CcmH n=1 Tax=Shimia isoporae TaxID=647720 RepID=A0A4R1NLF6_9RHOB|nr:c-type cytochrome biogenesis protein CcmI [Shimia isoporae]TCL09094.1 cytochrome c-type biogenesis protein CcmH [Shimia isoporae]
MIFWIVAGAFALVSIALMALAVLRRPEEEEHPAAYDLRVYRDQLKEVDKDLARGVINEGDAARIRTEVSRRILAADAQLQAADGSAQSGGPAQRVLVCLLAVAVVAGSFGLYAVLGENGADDQPLELRIAMAQERLDTRDGQTVAEANMPPPQPITPDAEFADLMDKLRKAVADNPDDLNGHVLLAQNEARLNNLTAAYDAQAQVIRIKGDDVTPSDYLIHANIMISAAGGYVSPEAQDSLRKALDMEPSNLLGRYYWGLMLMQNGRPDATFRLWDKVLMQSPPDAPWVSPIRQRITDLSWFAGVKDYQMPSMVDPHSGAMLPGPSAEDMEAAEDMDAGDRQDMIRNMVEGLAERLATEGGTPEEWARLLTAYGVLGERDRAALIWEEAQQVFASSRTALEIVREGARNAGVAP